MEEATRLVRRENLPFDTDVLGSYLRRRLGLSGAMKLEPVAGGQSNPTYFLDFGPRRFVLRKKPPGKLLPSAHAVDREFRVQSALAGSGVPVAPMVLYHSEPDIVGTPFYLMERVEGRIFAESSLKDVARHERRMMYRSVAEVLAAIHSIDIDTTGLRDFGKSFGYLARQLERWSGQWELSRDDGIAEIDELAEWLREHLPDESGDTTLVHGDFRIGNLIFHPRAPRVSAVLDWELSTLGDPMADLAHCCIYAWYNRPEEYGGILGLDLEVEALPSLEEFVADYMAAFPARRSLGRYHLAFALFRNAVIFAGIAARARTGNAASKDAAEAGRLAPVFARRGLSVALEQENEHGF
jgi:aminoglycoside phosphotransferase (APT) family kinase protein